MLEKSMHTTSSKHCNTGMRWQKIGWVEDIVLAIPLLQQDAPHKHMPPQYGQKIQYAIEDDPLPTLPAIKIKQTQAVVGCLLYYARQVDPT
eukprot:2441690-Ditylum_brightwellii.AAC.1